MNAKKGWSSGVNISREVVEKSDSVIPDLTVFNLETVLNHTDF